MNWEKDFAEMIYAYNRNEDKMLFIEDKMHKKMKKFIKSLVEKEIKEIIGEDEKETTADIIHYHDGSIGNIDERAASRNSVKMSQRKLAKKRGWDI